MKRYYQCDKIPFIWQDKAYDRNGNIIILFCQCCKKELIKPSLNNFYCPNCKYEMLKASSFSWIEIENGKYKAWAQQVFCSVPIIEYGINENIASIFKTIMRGDLLLKDPTLSEILNFLSNKLIIIGKEPK